jgi:hypothetical protein
MLVSPRVGVGTWCGAAQKEKPRAEVGWGSVRDRTMLLVHIDTSALLALPASVSGGEKSLPLGASQHRPRTDFRGRSRRFAGDLNLPTRTDLRNR